MKKNYIILVAIFILSGVEGSIFRVIDDFTDAPYLARYIPTAAESNDNVAPYTWFSPYTNPSGFTAGTPYKNVKNVANVMGGQRDIIIGHYSTMSSTVITSVIVNRATATFPARLSIALQSGFNGAIYLQYDGIDTDQGAESARLGKELGTDGGLGSNADGTVDFTFGGAAKGIQVRIMTDLPITYQFSAVSLSDDTTQENSGNYLDFTVNRNDNTPSQYFYFTFDDSRWSEPSFDWTHVAGFQLKLAHSVIDDTAPDASVFAIQILTFQVSGTVRQDCVCGSGGSAGVAGTRVDLYDTSVSTTTPISFTTTDGNGAYSFYSEFAAHAGAIAGTTTFRICLHDPSILLCGTAPNTQNGCYDFTTQAYVDILDKDFEIVQPTGCTCVPDCAGKTCGADGCAGSCGSCSGSDFCSTEGVCLVSLPVTLDSAVELSLGTTDQAITVNNVYDASEYNPEIPSDSCFSGASNPIWYHVSSSSIKRSITVSTCTTSVDTVIGLYLADGTLVECNDDRCESQQCGAASSYIQTVVDPNEDFYIVVAGNAPSATGNIDLRIQADAEVDDLIEESTNAILTALSQDTTEVKAHITSEIAGLTTNVNNRFNTVDSEISTLSGSVDGHFTDLTSALDALETAINANVATATGSLSDQISDLVELLGQPSDTGSCAGISAAINTILTNVNGVATDVDALSTSVGTANSALGSISEDLGTLSSDVAAVDAHLGTQTEFINTVRETLEDRISDVEDGVVALTDGTTTRFNTVTSAINGVSATTSSILQSVAAGNTVGNNIYNFIRNEHFQSYLLYPNADLDAIPWQWRIPEAAGGSMGEILTYLVNLYNTKLAACQGLTTTYCNSFRSTTTTPYSTLVSSYNSQVTHLRYKKAFQVLQTFYVKLFPTANWQ